MSRRSKIWRVVAAVFTVVNLGGAGYAVGQGEMPHAAVHIALLVATYLVWRFTTRARRPALQHTEQVDQRLDRLQQSLDAMAIEVERIGEAQRFMVKVQTERAQRSPPSEP